MGFRCLVLIGTKEVAERDQTDSPGSTRFGDVVDRWLTEIVTRKLEDDPTQLYLCPSTSERYQASVRDFLKPAFGDREATEISSEEVRLWRNSIRQAGYAASTTNAHLRVLRSVLRTVGSRVGLTRFGGQT